MPSVFSFEEAEFIRQLKHKNYEPDIVEDWWGYDEYGSPEDYDAEYDQRTDQVEHRCCEFDTRADKELRARKKWRAG